MVAGSVGSSGGVCGHSRAPVRHVSVSKRTICLLQVFSSPFPSPPVGVAALVSTSLILLWLAQATTSCSLSAKLQVHIDLLTGRVWLVSTFKTTTAETAARNFVASVFRDVGLQDVLVSDRDTRFTSAFWTGMHAVLCATLIVGWQQLQHHHNTTTSKVEHINGTISDVLCSLAGD